MKLLFSTLTFSSFHHLASAWWCTLSSEIYRNINQMEVFFLSIAIKNNNSTAHYFSEKVKKIIFLVMDKKKHVKGKSISQNLLNSFLK